jgi:hypothetical protein
VCAYIDIKLNDDVMAVYILLHPSTILPHGLVSMRQQGTCYACVRSCVRASCVLTMPRFDAQQACLFAGGCSQDCPSGSTWLESNLSPTSSTVQMGACNRPSSTDPACHALCASLWMAGFSFHHFTDL